MLLESAEPSLVLTSLSRPKYLSRELKVSFFLIQQIWFVIDKVFKPSSKDLPGPSLQHWPSWELLDFQVYQHSAHFLYKFSSSWIGLSLYSPHYEYRFSGVMLVGIIYAAFSIPENKNQSLVSRAVFNIIMRPESLHRDQLSLSL